MAFNPTILLKVSIIKFMYCHYTSNVRNNYVYAKSYTVERIMLKVKRELFVQMVCTRG